MRLDDLDPVRHPGDLRLDRGQVGVDAVQLAPASRRCRPRGRAWSALSWAICGLLLRDLLLERGGLGARVGQLVAAGGRGRGRRAEQPEARAGGGGRRPRSGATTARDVGARTPSRRRSGEPIGRAGGLSRWRCHRASKLRGSFARVSPQGRRRTVTPAGSSPSRSGTSTGRHRLSGHDTPRSLAASPCAAERDDGPAERGTRAPSRTGMRPDAALRAGAAPPRARR